MGKLLLTALSGAVLTGACAPNVADLKLQPGPHPQPRVQAAPRVIPEFGVDQDDSGRIATYQPSGITRAGGNPFFQNIGTNGRTCFTCHQPQDGWTISAASAQARFDGSAGTDPLFRLVDGATCPTADVSTLQARQHAYQLATGRGLIRIGLPLPATRQFEVSSVADPYNCTTNRPRASRATKRAVSCPCTAGRCPRQISGF